jgi:hypothetical protein
MTHIANCMRPGSDMYSFYITEETSSTINVSGQDHSYDQMYHHLPRRSRSLRDLQAVESNTSPTTPPVTASSLANSTQPTTSRYQLWPVSRSPVGLSKSGSSFDKISALSVGRSSTSLSDTAVLPESVPFWQRTGSLARRRKVSVPELLGNTMTTVQEVAIDSRKWLSYYHK